MPIEEIHKILRERELRAKEKADAEIVAAEKVKSEARERQIFIVKQTERILEESGALRGIKKIDAEMLEGNVLKHDVSCSPSTGTLALVWGKGYKINSVGEVQSMGSFEEPHEYSLVTVVVDPDTEKLTVRGQNIVELEPAEWKDNKKVDKALAQAYVDPERKKYSYESYRGPAPSCCCGT